eukprot:130221-Amphidinium_carterae.1
MESVAIIGFTVSGVSNAHASSAHQSGANAGPCAISIPLLAFANFVFGVSTSNDYNPMRVLPKRSVNCCSEHERSGEQAAVEGTVLLVQLRTETLLVPRTPSKRCLKRSRLRGKNLF